VEISIEENPFPMTVRFQEMDGEMRKVLEIPTAENPAYERIDKGIMRKAKQRAIQVLASRLKREARRTSRYSVIQLRLFA